LQAGITAVYLQIAAPLAEQSLTAFSASGTPR